MSNPLEPLATTSPSKCRPLSDEEERHAGHDSERKRSPRQCIARVAQQAASTVPIKDCKQRRSPTSSASREHHQLSAKAHWHISSHGHPYENLRPVAALSGFDKAMDYLPAAEPTTPGREARLAALKRANTQDHTHSKANQSPAPTRGEYQGHGTSRDRSVVLNVVTPRDGQQIHGKSQMDTSSDAWSIRNSSRSDRAS